MALALGRLKQEDHSEFEASLDCILRFCLMKTKKEEKEKKRRMERRKRRWERRKRRRERRKEEGEEGEEGEEKLSFFTLGLGRVLSKTQCKQNISKI